MNTRPLIASPRPLFGQSLLDKQDGLLLAEKFSQPQAIEHYLEQMVGAGVKSIILPLDERVLSVVRKRRDLPIEVIPLVPNVMGLVREATEYGMMGAGFRLVRRLGLGTMFRLGVRSLPKAPQILKKHFPTMLSVLFDLELSLFRSFKPRRVLLHPQICDLALAMGSREIFEGYAKVLRERFKVEPGVTTGNFGTLAESLTAWQTPIRLVLVPVNEAGWLMKPTRAACEKQLNDERWHILADRVTLSPPPTKAQIEKTLQWKAVHEVVVDVVDWSTKS